MDRTEFHEQLERLRKVYSGETYQNERAELIFQRMKWLDAEDFREVVSDLITNYVRAPLLPQFEETAKKYRQKHSDLFAKKEAEWAEKQPHCPLCNKSGIVTALLKNANHSRYAFTCTCPIGIQAKPGYPFWNETKHGEKYQIEVFGNPSFHAEPKSLRELAKTLIREMPEETTTD